MRCKLKGFTSSLQTRTISGLFEWKLSRHWSARCLMPCKRICCASSLQTRTISGQAGGLMVSSLARCERWRGINFTATEKALFIINLSFATKPIRMLCAELFTNFFVHYPTMLITLFILNKCRYKISKTAFLPLQAKVFYIWLIYRYQK